MLAAVAAWATIPLGSVAHWTHALLCLLTGIATLVAIVLLPRPPTTSGSVQNAIPGASWARLSLILLAGWIAVQCLALPAPLHRYLHPRLWRAFPEILADAPRMSVALDVGRVPATALLWGAYALLTWGAMRIAESRHASRVMAVAIAGIPVAQAVYGLLMLGTPALRHMPFPSVRLCGTFSGANALGGLLALGIPVCLGILMTAVAGIPRAPVGRRLAQAFHVVTSTSHGIAALLLVPCLSILIVALFFTASRGATLATAAASTALLLAYLRKQRSGAGHLSLAALILVVGALVAVIGAGGVYALLADRLSTLETGTDTSLRARLAMIPAVLDMLAMHPFGVGPGCFAIGFSRFQTAGFGATRVYKAHNDYLHLATELGIPGILLLLPVAVFAIRHLGRALRGAGAGSLPWLSAGAAASVVAMLLHATVDFNLTSRPGVAIPCCLALGFVIGCNRRASGGARHTVPSGPQTVSGAARSTVPPPSWARARLRSAPVLLLALTATSLALPWLHAELAARQAYHAMGGPPDPYFWLTPRRAAANLNMLPIQNAIRLLPFDAEFHQILGRAHNLIAARTLRTRIDAALASQPDGASTNQIERFVHVASRQELCAAYTAAAGAFSRAVTLSPWEPEYRIDLAEALARTALPNDTTMDPIGAQALVQAHRAATLAPRNGHVLAHAAQAAATALQYAAAPGPAAADAKARLRDWSVSAIHLDPSSRYIAFDALLRAGVGMKALVAAQSLPADALWALFTHLRTARHPATPIVLAALNHILERPDAQAMPSSFATERVAETLQRLRAQASQAMLRQMPMEGDLAAYRQAGNQRIPLWQDATTRLLGDAPVQWALAQRRAPRLRELYATQGLPPEWQRWLAVVESVQGTDKSVPIRMLCESLLPEILFGLTVAPDIAAAQRAAAMTAHDAQVMAVMDSLAAPSVPPASGTASHAAARGPMPDMPASCRSLLELRSTMQSGGISRLDPLALARLTAPATPPHELAPPIRTDVAYLGGRLVLLGFDAHPRIAAGTLSGYLLTTYWQVNGNIPPDTELSLAALDADGHWIAGSQSAFAAAAPEVVRLHNYHVGQVIRVTNILSARAHQSSSLRFHLQHQKRSRTVTTLEGLSAFEIGKWLAFLRPTILMRAGRDTTPPCQVVSPRPEQSATILDRLRAAWGDTWPSAVMGTGGAAPLTIHVHHGDVDALSGLDLTGLGPDAYCLSARQDGIHVLATTDTALDAAIAQLGALLAPRPAPEDKPSSRTRRDLTLALYDPLWHTGVVPNSTSAQPSDATEAKP